MQLAAARRFTPTCVGKAHRSVEHSGDDGRFTPTCVGKAPRPILTCRYAYRFTPTCVGKAVGPGAARSSTSVHPHVCGEGAGCERGRAGVRRFTPTCVGKARWRTRTALFNDGSPPRVWGRRRHRRRRQRGCPVHPHVCGEGGNRIPGGHSLAVHPHVCGEGVGDLARKAVRDRFTPTCVGKAPRLTEFKGYTPGSPPRVWGRRLPPRAGTVSSSVHPHVCGEGVASASATCDNAGSPPRVWGRRRRVGRSARPLRFTPTCVGKARSISDQYRGRSVHPHVCGEGDDDGPELAGRVGSPPRVWGRRFRWLGPRRRPRFTPTCVGKAITPVR